MSKRFLRLTFPLILIIAAIFLGPSPDKPTWNATVASVPTQAQALTSYVEQKENQHKLKPDNEARIVWADSTMSKTKYSVVYLHGFSASQKEGDPVHKRFAEQFGCNLYLARLSDHGIDTTDALLNFTTDRWWESSKEALAIGKAIGENVILMSTSTGGTMALALAAEFPKDVFALINMSPNIRINNGAAFILNDPWGLQIARLVMGGKYSEWDAPPQRAPYWYSKYRLEATVQLEEMLESKMNENTFNKVNQPCLTLYYYKNEEAQDPEVKVSAMLAMMDQLSTPENLKRAVAIPSAGAHVLGSDLVSKDVESVYSEIEKFSREVLQLEER
jgi:esterase/lipase